MLLVRPVMFARDRLRQIEILFFLAALLAAAGYQAQAQAMLAAVHTGLPLLAGPYRSWVKGMSRVGTWSFDNMYSAEVCWAQMRTRKEDIPRLAKALRLPEVIETNGHVFSQLEALVTFLHRMAHPGSWESKLQFLGGRARAAYSCAFYFVLYHIYNHFHDRITSLVDWHNMADVFADAIHTVAPACRCIGFVDGTFRTCARPGGHNDIQRQLYSGYYKLHGLKFQTVVSPNGLIIDLFGPVLGRRGDGYMLRASNLLHRMAQLCARANQPYYIYGDPAYPLGQYILRGYKRTAACTAAQRAFSTAMSRVRESVEWGYQLITANWQYLDFTRTQWVRQQPIGMIYFVGALLTNIHSCLYGNIVYDFFRKTYNVPALRPPMLEEYLAP